MIVCLLQCDPALRHENVVRLGRVIARVPVDLYVLPELFTIGFEAAAVQWQKAAEPIPGGQTIKAIAGFLRVRPESAVICGVLEREGPHLYNAAAVVGTGWVERYRQKHRARDAGGRVLPAVPGDFRMVWVGPKEYGYQCRIGLMIGNDCFAAEEFFRHYQENKTDAIVMIADSNSRAWIEQFPAFCQRFSLPAVMCNAAGQNKGGSCVLDREGQFVTLRTTSAGFEYLAESPAVAIASL